MTEPQKPKRINIASGKFEANGHTYYIQTQLCVSRYQAYLQMSHELYFGVTFEQIYDKLNQIWKLASSGNDLLHALHQIREISYNQINSVVDFVHRDQPSILYFCCLFCNREDEDTKVWDERMIDEKIQDWTKEGLDIEDFFYLAANYNPEFIQRYKEQQPPSVVAAAQKSKETTSTDHPTDSTTRTSKESSK